MFALGEHRDQALRLQPLQMHAGCRRGDVGDGGKLGARMGAAVSQAVEHARPGWLADGGGNGRDGIVRGAAFIV